MSDLIHRFAEWAGDPSMGHVYRSGLLLFVVLPLVFLLSRIVRRAIEKRHTKQSGMLAGKAVSYLGFVLVTITVLREFGFDLGALLGAAGVMAVAIGFAAQSRIHGGP